MTAITNFYRVCFENEAPRIGAGWRTVFLEHDGRKWVRLRCPFTGASVSLSRTVWLDLCRTAKPAHPRVAVIRRALKARDRLTGQKLNGRDRAMIATASGVRPREQRA